MPELSEDLTLTLQTDPSIDQFEAKLSSVAQNFGATLSDQIEAALGAGGTVVALTADPTALTSEGDAAVQAIDGTVTLTADTSDLTTQGNAAAQSVFEAQVSNVAGGVGNAQGIIAEGTAAAAAAESVNALTTANRGLATANAGLEGSVGGVTSALGPLGVGLAGVVGVAGVFFENAVQDAEAADRMNFVFGTLTSTIEQVNLPANNFNLSFQQIARTTGTADEAIQQAAAHIGQLGNSSGATAPQITQTVQQIIALASFLRTTNPALGDTATISDGLTAALARGGRALTQYGLALTTSEIQARALRDTGKSTAAELTTFDKAAAGAAITVERLGPALGKGVSEGADSAALALPQLKERLREVVDAVGAPLIGPITQTFTNIEPLLASLATTIGRLLQALTPIVSVAGVFLKVLGDLANIINTIPLPVLTIAVEAFTASLVAEKVFSFTAGLLTLGADAVEATGGVGLLTGAVDSLVLSLGPVGILVGAIAGSRVLNEKLSGTGVAASNEMALAVAGIKSNTDIAGESAAKVQTQLDAVNKKIQEVQATSKRVSPDPLTGLINSVLGIGNYTNNVKALNTEADALKAKLDGVKSSTDGVASSQANGATAAASFATTLQSAAQKASGVTAVLQSYSATVNTDVSNAGGQATSVFSAVGAAAVSAAQALKTSGSAASSAAADMATAAQHAKDLRDAISALATANKDLAILAAGPTAHDVAAGLLADEAAAKTTRDAEQKLVDTRTALATLAAGPTADQMAAGWLADAQAARTAQAAEQAVVDARVALAALTAGPTPDTEAKAQEDIAKATDARQKAALGLSDAQAQQAAIIGAGTATDRQKEDAQLAVNAATFTLTDATRTLNDAQAAEAKLRSDSLPGSRAMTEAETKLKDAELSLDAAKQSQAATQKAQNQLVADSLPGSQAMVNARNAESDAELALAQAQQSQADTQAKQNQLFLDAQPGSAAYLAAVQKIADAQDHLVQVQESGAAKSQAAASKQAKASVDALGDLQKGLDDSLATENKFYADLAKIQSEGGLQIVAELLALGPKQGAAEASAVAAATPTVVSALETKTETLKTAEDTHAQEIATVFAASLNSGLVKAFATQLRNETDFFANVESIFRAGNTALASEILKLGPTQGAATAQAVASATPTIQAALESQAQQLKTVEANAGKDAGTAYGTGLVSGIGSQIPAITAAGAIGGAALHTGATTALQARSPSRLGQQLAEDYASGLVIGMQGSVPLVAAAAAQLANALVVSPNSPALTTGTTAVSTGGASTGPGPVINNVVVNEVAQDPQATAFAVSARLALGAMR